MRMFHKRALFFPEHVSSEQARVSRCLIILRRYLRDFVAKSSYRTSTELPTNARRKEIELELQAREEGESRGKDLRPV